MENKTRNLVIGVIIIVTLLVLFGQTNLKDAFLSKDVFLASGEEIGLTEQEQRALRNADSEFVKGDMMDPGAFKEVFSELSTEKIIDVCKNKQISLNPIQCIRMAAIFKENINEIEQLCNEINFELCEISYKSDKVQGHCKNNNEYIKEACKSQFAFYY